jgi:hypothetical protein
LLLSTRSTDEINNQWEKAEKGKKDSEREQQQLLGKKEKIRKKSFDYIGSSHLFP